MNLGGFAPTSTRWQRCSATDQNLPSADDLHAAGAICDRGKNAHSHVLRRVLADRDRVACHWGQLLSKGDHDVRVHLGKVIGVAILGKDLLAEHRGGRQQRDYDLSDRQGEPYLRIDSCCHKHLHGSLAMNLQPEKQNIR